MAQQLFAIALAGGIGSALRYLLYLGATKWLGETFPWGTFAANVIGSLLLGVVAQSCAGREIFGVDARLVLGTGVLGGFTTYSSFNLEVLRLAQDGSFARAALYTLGTVATCLIAGLGGIALVRAIRGE